MVVIVCLLWWKFCSFNLLLLLILVYVRFISIEIVLGWKVAKKNHLGKKQFCQLRHTNVKHVPRRERERERESARGKKEYEKKTNVSKYNNQLGQREYLHKFLIKSIFPYAQTFFITNLWFSVFLSRMALFLRCFRRLRSIYTYRRQQPILEKKQKKRAEHAIRQTTTTTHKKHHRIVRNDKAKKIY